jgi:hypothetical protein
MSSSQKLPRFTNVIRITVIRIVRLLCNIDSAVLTQESTQGRRANIQTVNYPESPITSLGGRSLSKTMPGSSRVARWGEMTAFAPD